MRENFLASLGVHDLLSFVVAFSILIGALAAKPSSAEDARQTPGLPESSGGLEIKASADKPKAVVGEEITVTIVARARVEPGKHYDVLNAKFPALKSLDIVNSSSSGRSIADEKGAVKERILKYTFRPTEKGEAETGEIQVEYTFTGAPEPKPGQTAGNKPHDEGPGREPEGKDDFLTRTLPSIKFEVPTAMLGGAALVIIISIAIVIMIGTILSLRVIAKRRRERQAAAGEREAAEDIEGDFLQRLDGLQELRISGEIKRYCGRIVDILSDYLEKKFEIDVSSGPSALDVAREQIGVDTLGRINDILHTSDQIRFAGYEPSSHELDRILNTVREILNKNRPVTEEVKPEDEIELRDETDD